MVQEAVREHLVRNYPKAFACRSSSDLLLEKATTEKNKVTDISGSLKTLASLNGFQSVPVAKAHEKVFLAEGVYAMPNFYSRLRGTERFVLLSQQSDEYGQPDDSKTTQCPKLVEEDIKIYRILESRVDQYLDAKYNQLRQWARSKMAQVLVPAKALIARARGETDAEETPEESEVETALPVPQKGTGQKENLLVISEKDIVLISNVDPYLRLLTLPHTMGHKGASTVIYVSLILGAALPMTYRSLNFILNNPSLSKAIAASVVLSVSYSIWSSRDAARDRQSEVVSRGIAHRVYARDDAVLWVLQEGAIRRTSKAILNLYFHYRQRDDVNDSAADETEGKTEITETVGIDAMPHLPQSIVNPWDTAKEIGLLERMEDENEWVATSFEEASFRLKKSQATSLQQS